MDTRLIFALVIFSLWTWRATCSKSTHTNNWAVLVCTSRYWFNYRHIANTLSIYRSVKRLGIPDSNIILMLADDMACNSRNPRPATVFNNANEAINVYGDDVEVDYRGYEVTVENLIRVLTGRLDSSVPRSKRLLTDDRSNVLIYMTGHGGNGFLKFQDSQEISDAELAAAFEQMWQKKRYNEILFLIDSCQAASMFKLFYSPNIIAASSSRIGEESLSHHPDEDIGVHIIDRWTNYALEFLEGVTPASQVTMKDFFSSFKKELTRSTPTVRDDLFRRKLSDALVTDFFGSIRSIELMNTTLKHDDKVYIPHVEHVTEDVHGEDITLPTMAYYLQPWEHVNISNQELSERYSADSSYIPVAMAIVVGAIVLIAAGLHDAVMPSSPKDKLS